MTLVTDGTWKTADNPGANWHNRPLDTRNWPAAEVLGDYGMAPWGKLKFAHADPAAALVSAHGFRVDKPVRRATLYATGAGDLRRPPERPPRQRRLVQPRLDRLHQAGLLPRLRRDRPGPARRQRPGGDPRRRLVQRLRRLRQEARPLRHASRGSARSLHLELADGTTADIVTGPGLEGVHRPDPARPTS